MDKLVENILKVYNVSTECERAEGMTWYNDARKICKRLARKYKVPFQSVVWTMAALSPNNKWHRNITDCERVLKLYTSGELTDRFVAYTNGDKDALRGIACTYTANVVKAFEILAYGKLEALKGLKVNNFAQNIYSAKSDAVTIDFHAISIALDTRFTIDTVKGVNFKGKNYEKFVDAYREAAKIVGLQPFELQAITWTTWRNLDKVK